MVKEIFSNDALIRYLKEHKNQGEYALYYK